MQEKSFPPVAQSHNNSAQITLTTSNVVSQPDPLTPPLTPPAFQRVQEASARISPYPLNPHKNLSPLQFSAGRGGVSPQILSRTANLRPKFPDVLPQATAHEVQILSKTPHRE